MTNKRRNLQNQFFESVISGNPSGATILPLLLAEISSDISDGIGRINKASAPMVIAILEQYAEALRKQFRCADAIISQFKSIPTAMCIVQIPNTESEEL